MSSNPSTPSTGQRLTGTSGADTAAHAASRDPGGRRTSRWLRLLAVVGPILGLLVALLIPSLLSTWLLPSEASEPAPGEVVTYVALQSVVVALLAVGAAALLLRVHKLRLRDAGLRWTRTSAAYLLLGIGLAAAVVLAVGLPLTRLGLLRPNAVPDLPLWALLIAGVAQAALLQGFPEELLFRGYQMTALRARPVVAVFVSAAVFGVLHLVSNGGQESTLERILYLALPFGFAVTAGALMIVTGSLWAAVGIHSGLHVGTLIGLFLGLGNGPWLWVVGGAVYTAVGLVLLAVAHRRGRLAGVWTGPTR